MKKFMQQILVYSILIGVASSLFAAAPVAEKEKVYPKVHYEIMSNKHLYDDAELSAYVTEVGQRIVDHSDKPNREYNFFVLDDKNVNAFTPGHGLVYINRGLLGLLTSEAQLAGVLAHEIGHDIGGHVKRGKRRRTLGSLGAIAAAVLIGNSGIKRAIDMSNAERFGAFSRELELEADEYGAEYLYRSNYDPAEMLGVLGVLKDYEMFIGRISGGKNKTYHGVFSDHPRSDKRLQEVVLKAGTLPPGENFRGRNEFREVLTGLVYGENYDGNKTKDQARFTHKGLGITFVYPKDWSQFTKGKKIILNNPDKTLQLIITAEKTLDTALSSQEVLTAKYPDELENVEQIHAEEEKDTGTKARKPQQRVAIIFVGSNTYSFQGLAKDNQLSEEQDAALVEIITSFRRASRKDLLPNEVNKVYYRRLEPGETFFSLSANSALGIYTEAHLRLMNGYYPKGEAEPGTYIKLIKKQKKLIK